MKKITILGILLLFSLGTYAQGLDLEDFDTWPPTGWGIYDNGFDTVNSWQQNDPANPLQPAFEGSNCAFVSRNNVLPNITLPQDWLITPQFTLPANAQLRFYSRLTLNANQGSLYRVLISNGAVQSDLGDFELVQEWTELEINPSQQQYNEVVVSLPADMEGELVYVAFVMEGDEGDRWLIDNVKVVEKCMAPENLSADNIMTTTAILDWDNPSLATDFEIAVLPNTVPFDGTGEPYSGAVPLTRTGLIAQTEYKFYVRALCTPGNYSDWAGPFVFTTQGIGDSCNEPIVVNSLPYTASGTTADYADNYDGNAGVNCSSSTWSDDLSGNDAVFSYTAPADGIISIDLYNLETTSGVFIYDSCENIGITCIGGSTSGWDGSTATIPSFPVTANETYYFVISSWFAPTTNFTINIQQESCPKPTDITVANASLTSIDVSWTEAGSAASWQYSLQPFGEGLPMTGGTTVSTTGFTISPLPESTQFEFYVRADCGDGTFSSWTGPVTFNTLCGAFSVPFYEGFNSDSEAEFCWTVSNVNADDYMWNLNKDFDPQDPFGQGNPYEGDQAAHFDTSAVPEHNDMLISPAILLTGNQRLKFHCKTDDVGAVGFKVMLSTTGTDPEDFTTELMPLTSFATSTYVQKTINLSAVPAGPVYIAWHIPQDFNPGYQLMIDNVIIEDLPACTEPVDLVVSDITSSAASLSWTPGNGETVWEVLVVPNGSPLPTDTTPGIPVTGPYLATGLTPQTQHRFYIRSVCGSTHSAWEYAVFTTACQIFNVPFFEGFNSNSTSDACWNVLNLDGDGANWCWIGPGCSQGTYEGDRAPVINTSWNSPNNNDWLISPPIQLTANQRLKYHYRVDESSGNAKFKVLLSTTQREPEDFTEVLVPEETYSNNNYVKEVVSLEAYTGVVYIAWQVPPEHTGESILILDNIIIEEIPVCPEPLYVEVENITQTSAEVSWTAGGSETQWEVLVYADGDDIPANGLLVTSTAITLDTLPDGQPLQSGTIYHILVKAVCDAANSSIVSDGVSFVTLISNDECTTATAVPVNTGVECVVYAAGTVNGATESAQANPCGDWTFADDDVWFEFTATSPSHSVSIIDISSNGEGSGMDTFLMFIVYEGDSCGNLTQISDCMGAYAEYGIESSTAYFNTLTVGSNYKIRIFSAEENTNQTSTFKVCVKIPAIPIAVNNTEYTVPELVTDILFGQGCAQISNISWSTGTNYPDPDNIFGDNPSGIAYFNQNGSTFPLSEGILLTTGNALLAAPSPSYAGMEQGSAVWLGDPDIDQVMSDMLGDNIESTNASVIEFDFVPSVPMLNFDFIFASEEYGDFIQCFSWDTFAILLTDEDGNEQNIAVIPGTDLAISVWNISGAAYPQFCPGYNLPWFGQYNVGGSNQDNSPTAFAGQTVTMTAVANVEINKQYHLKIAIAEANNNLDSGVFIKAGNYAGEINLGNDMLVASNTALCPGETHTLNNGLNAALYSFSWLKGNEVIEGATSSTLVITEAGEYTAQAQLSGYDCTITDSIIIEYYAPVVFGNAPLDIVICDTAAPQFDLTQNNAVILDGLTPADYTITYHTSEADAIANVPGLVSPYAGMHNQTIYVRLQKNNTGCYAVGSFKLLISQVINPVTAFNYTTPVCMANSSVAPVTVTGFTAGGVFSSVPSLPINPDTGVIDLAAAVEGDYVITYTISANPATCNTGGISTFNLTINAVDIPVTSFDYEDSYCTSILSITPSLGQGFTTGGIFTVTPEGLDVNPATGEVNTGNSAVGDYTITYTIVPDNTTCTPGGSFSDTFILDQEVVLLLEGNCENNEYILEASVEGSLEAAVYEWFTANGMQVGDNNNVFNVTRYVSDTPEEEGFPIIFTVIVTNGECQATEIFTVPGITCQIPKGISPGNDDKNNSFDLSDMNVAHLSIFNRYGQEVYSYGNYTNQWIGQDKNGDKLPTGTYFYSIQQANGETKTGWVYVNRQD